MPNARSCTSYASTSSLNTSGTHDLLPSQAKQGEEGFRRQSSGQSESEAMAYRGGIEGDKEAAYQYSSDTSLPVQDGGLQWSIGGVPLQQQLRYPASFIARVLSSWSSSILPSICLRTQESLISTQVEPHSWDGHLRYKNSFLCSKSPLLKACNVGARLVVAMSGMTQNTFVGFMCAVKWQAPKGLWLFSQSMSCSLS